MEWLIIGLVFVAVVALATIFGKNVPDKPVTDEEWSEFQAWVKESQKPRMSKKSRGN